MIFFCQNHEGEWEDLCFLSCEQICLANSDAPGSNFFYYIALLRSSYTQCTLIRHRVPSRPGTGLARLSKKEGSDLCRR